MTDWSKISMFSNGCIAPRISYVFLFIIGHTVCFRMIVIKRKKCINPV